VAGGVLEDHGLQRARVVHQALDGLGFAPVKIEAFGVAVQALFVRVEFVGGDVA
jgi:hypothetical protein